MTDRDSTLRFDPAFDANGLVTAVVTDRAGALLMDAHECRGDRRDPGEREATFWSRSRQRLWKKGETSGNVLHVVEMRVDCDQDALWVIADAAGPACHTGAPSCFYRRIEGEVLGAAGHELASGRPVAAPGRMRPCRLRDRPQRWRQIGGGGDRGGAGARSEAPRDRGGWALDTDRMCIVGHGSAWRSTMARDRASSASGTVQRDGETLKVTLRATPVASTRSSMANVSVSPRPCRPSASSSASAGPRLRR